MVKAKKNNRMTLSEKVRCTKMWQDLSNTLKDPVTKDQKEKLAVLAKYLEERYANEQPEFARTLEDPKGGVIKTFMVMDSTDDVMVENTPNGPVFWIAGAGPNGTWFSTKGNATLVYDYSKNVAFGEEDSHWTLREKTDNGTTREITRKGDKMTVSRKTPARQVRRVSKQAGRLD